MADLFENVEPLRPSRESMAEGAVVLHGNALAFEDALLAALQGITAQAPFRHMVTPGGFTMSVSMTNCGAVGWVTDRTGYRYDRVDPGSGLRSCRFYRRRPGRNKLRAHHCVARWTSRDRGRDTKAARSTQKGGGRLFVKWASAAHRRLLKGERENDLRNASIAHIGIAYRRHTLGAPHRTH